MINQKHNAIIILTALLEGNIIEIKETKYGMDEKNRILVMNEDNETGIAIDFPINDFISWCEKVSEDEVFLIGASVALSRVKLRKYYNN